MPYLVVEDFRNGMDRRRPRANGIPGSLWKAENCVISRGGDVQKAKKFVSQYSLPAGTFGMARVAGELYVFASTAKTVPAGVQCQVLAAPSTPNMTKILDVVTPASKAYVIAQYDDGNIHHFYDGVRVSDWDALADANASFSSLATFIADEISADNAIRAVAFGNEIIIQARTPGTPFTLTTSTTDGGGTNDQTAAVTTVTANVAEVANVDATATVTLTDGSSSSEGANRVDQITVDGANMMATAVNFSTSLSATANLIAQEINNKSGDHGYTATADGAVVTIAAPVSTGTTYNGEVVAVTTAGDVTANKTDMAGGVDYVAPVAQESKITFGGTEEPADLFTVTLNGTDYKTTMRASAMGTKALVHKNRVYVAAFDVVRYSKIDDFDDFTDATASSGAGFISVANASGASRVVVLGKYQDRVAIFTRDDTSTYFLETDAQTNAIDQTLENTGTIAPQSVLQYGSLDLFYLDETGVRSLRARDSSNSAFVSDAGSLVDDYVADLRAANTLTEVKGAKAIVEPTDGRYLLSIDDEILTYSNFPNSKISAWTVLKPGMSIGCFVRSKRDVFMRSGDTIYLYGGVNGTDYVDASDCVVETPFLDARQPATHKSVIGIDLVCEGLWKIEILTNPADDTVAQEIARIGETTLNKYHINCNIASGIFAIRATCLSSGAASLSQVIVHYKKEQAG